MNFVGKVLIVLNVCLCLLFMAFASAVYTAQKNWGDAIAKGKTSLQNLQAQMDQDRAGQKLAMDKLTSERDLAIQARGKFEADFTNVRDQFATASKDRDEAAAQRNSAQIEAKIASDESRSRIAEAALLRKETSKLRSKIDTLIDEKRVLQDDLISLKRTNAAYEEKQIALLERLGNQERLLRTNDIDPDEVVDTYVQDPPPRVFGLVVAARKNAARDTELVEVSIGSDDGLQKGHTLWVYRGEKFLADIRLIDVRPDKAVGQVVKRAKNGVIGRGDNVASRL